MRLLFALTLAVSARLASAQMAATDYSIHQDYVGTRALGMGNAFIATADDVSAMFYNPAMLAWRNRSELRLFVRAGATPSSLKLFDEVDKAGKDPDPESAYSNLIKSHYGDQFHYRAPTLGGSYVTQNWGIAFVPVDLSLDASVHRQLGPTLNVTSYLDSTLAYTYAHKLNWFGKSHQLSWGATAKAIHRFHISQALLAADLAQNASVWDTSLATEGLTYDADLSVAWRPPLPTGFFDFLRFARPSVALVGRNLVDHGFPTNFHILSKTSGTPPPLRRRFDLGTKWELPKLWILDPHVVADLRDVGHPNFSFRKGTHLGVEATWRTRSWWRGHGAVGLNQGYWTAGVGAKLYWVQFDVASYGEEVGTVRAPKESRRYLAELALDF